MLNLALECDLSEYFLLSYIEMTKSHVSQLDGCIVVANLLLYFFVFKKQKKQKAFYRLILFSDTVT